MNKGSAAAILLIIVLLEGGHSLLCDTLLRRSIANNQPFQLPYPEDSSEDVYKIADRLRAPPWNMCISVKEGWFIIKEHHWDHRDLLVAFQCADIC